MSTGRGRRAPIYVVAAVVAVALGLGGGYAIADRPEDPDTFSDAELRELSARVCGGEYVENDGWMDEDHDGHGWLVSDPEQEVLTFDQAVAQAIEDCRQYGLPHVNDGDMDGIHDYLDPETCFPGLPDGGPPPSGAPLCIELRD